MTFGEKLKSLRQSRYLTQQKLADDLGISQSAVGSYETGFREPDFKMIQRIADYFNVPFSSLMPSENTLDDELIQQIADSFHKNPKLGLLFDRTRYLTESDLDAVIAVVNAISKEQNNA